MKAVCIGDNCIDVYLPPVGRKYVGGGPVNVAYYLSKQGLDVSYLGVVGSDSDSSLIAQRLMLEGIDVSQVRSAPGPAGVTEVEVKANEKTPVKEFLGAQEDFALHGIFDPDQLEFIGQHDLIFYSPFTSWTYLTAGQFEYVKETALVNLKALKSLGRRLAIDYGEDSVTGLAETSLPLVDYAFVSASVLSRDAAMAKVKHMKELGCSTAVVTRGADGIIMAGADVLIERKPLPTKLVDTLGAGDSFIGTYLARIIQGDPLAKALDKAFFVAAGVCARFGGWGEVLQ